MAFSGNPNARHAGRPAEWIFTLGRNKDRPPPDRPSPGGGGAGGAGGTGGARQRKKVEVYPDPTALEGPDTLIVEDGKKRTFEYMLNAEDAFLSSGRGVLEFETDHPVIDVQTGIVVRNLRDGYVKVQLVVPEGAAEGTFKLTATLAGWQKSSGGLGPVLTYETALEVVDEIQNSGGNKTKSTGDKAADGAQVAVLWSNGLPRTATGRSARHAAKASISAPGPRTNTASRPPKNLTRKISRSRG